MVVANASKDGLPDLLSDHGFIVAGEPVPAPDGDHLGSLPGMRTRAFLKVQDGCDNRCTFCIVTVARGAARSRSLADIVEEVRDLTSYGYQEVVLTGVHLGSYGHDLDDPQGLETLIRKLLDATEIPRIRLSSLEPWDLRPELFALWSNTRLQPHLHLPLQSGCDATLARMARRTDQASFAELLAAARRHIPDVAISTDLIVGFPGECDAEFEESMAFVEAMGFSRLHVFRYSPREGTAAATMPGQLSGATIAARSERAHRLGARLEATFRQQFVGRTLDVLWETSEPFAESLRWSGLTGNYLRVVTETAADVNLRNTVQAATLTAAMPGALHGSVPTSVCYRQGTDSLENSLR
jgi:threonylcarbamoyladenosine tRNA methylthiotransferase MtaB